jgi:hypothetical protein
MKQLASPLAVERPAEAKPKPAEGDFGGRRRLDCRFRGYDPLT